ncbi:MAG TPA: SpoIIE family protein phosphatase [Terriglobia bacterium]|nr:SpoIIE family protein phosphatase [Terriglobia bacterium]
MNPLLTDGLLTAKFGDIPKGIKISVLSRVQEELHSAPELPVLFRNINRILREEFHCDAVLISIYDPEREEFVCNFPDTVLGDKTIKLHLGEGIAGKVGKKQTPLLLNDLRGYASSRALYRSLGVGCKRVLASPLIRRGNLLGVVELLYGEGSEPNKEEDLSYLAILCYQVAMGLNYFKLSEQAERSSLEEEKLSEVAQRISVSLDLDELLNLIIDALRALVPYDAAGIFLVDRQTQDIQRMVVFGYANDLDQAVLLNIGRNANQLMRETRNAVVLRDLSQYPVYQNVLGMTRSVMIAPIVVNKRGIGVFTLDSSEADAYTLQDLALFQKFANQAALSIEKAQLHQALMEKNKLERELSIAREIQRSFLPPREPSIKGYEVSGLNLPSRLVSGDYYDYIKIVEGQWGLVIGDVSGKGIPASLIMASFRASLLAEIRNNYAISTIMAKVNRLLWESTDSNQFVTAFYGVLDEQKRILTYCNAGHNPVLLIHADNSWEKLETGGLILGAFENSTYQESFIRVGPGEILLLYTDGVTEIFNDAGEEFGTERLVDLVKSYRPLDARALTLVLQEQVLDFAADQTIQDDFTLVVVKARE